MSSEGSTRATEKQPGEGCLFIVAAPSGAGKTSLVNALVARDPKLEISVSFTTRAPRPGEQDGVHYHFTTPEVFRKRQALGEFLEHAEVFGNLYGTHRQTTMDILAAGRDVILEIDWQGARQIKAAFPDCDSVFVLPPSLVTLRERLGARAQDSAAVIQARMDNARDEISHCDEFDHVIVNDDFDTALHELRSVVSHCRDGSGFVQQPIDDLLAELLKNG